MSNLTVKERATDRFFNTMTDTRQELVQWVRDVGEGRESFVDHLAAARKLMVNQQAFKATMQLNSLPIKKVLDETR